MLFCSIEGLAQFLGKKYLIFNLKNSLWLFTDGGKFDIM